MSRTATHGPHDRAFEAWKSADDREEAWIQGAKDCSPSNTVCWTGSRQFVFCLGEQVLWSHVAHVSREVGLSLGGQEEKAQLGNV